MQFDHATIVTDGIEGTRRFFGGIVVWTPAAAHHFRLKATGFIPVTVLSSVLSRQRCPVSRDAV